jgi:hypothetical protein
MHTSKTLTTGATLSPLHSSNITHSKRQHQLYARYKLTTISST